MHLRNQLTALFSPTRRLLGDDAAVVHAGGVLGPVERIVPRAQCHYRRIDVSALPARQRRSAARIAVRRHELGNDSAHHLAWQGGIAHAWIWPQPDPALTQTEQTWVPETLLRAPPDSDGLRLLRQQDGVEGQLWRDGRLLHSRWWPQAPGPEAWRRFVRACGLGPEAADPIPEVQALPWSPQPWGDAHRGLPGSPAALERLAWTAVLALVALGLGWQLTAQAGWSIALARVESRIETLQAQATPLLAARERADAAVRALQDFRQLQGGVSDYAMMAEVVQPLPADARLVGWVREGVRLQAALTSSQTDPRRFVSAFGDHPQLADVVATPGEGNAMQLDFTLPPPGAAGSGPGSGQGSR